MKKIDWESYGIDVDSAAFWDHYYGTVDNTIEREKNSDPKSEAEKIRSYCDNFRKFYADLIGAENAEKILDGVGENRRDFDAVYESLLRCIHDQKAESNRRMASILLKYAPKIREESGNAASVK